MLRKDAGGRRARGLGRATVQAELAQYIIRGLKEGKLKPGQRLPQKDLARVLRTSQAVIREGLAALEFGLLVEPHGARGIRVGPITDKLILDAYAAREAIEGMAIRLATRNASTVQVEELRELSRRVFDSKSGEGAVLAAYWHQRVYELANNKVIDSLKRLWPLTKIVARRERDPEAALLDLERRGRILDAMMARDEESAERLMREHIRIGRETMESLMRSGTFSLPEQLVVPQVPANSVR